MTLYVYATPSRLIQAEIIGQDEESCMDMLRQEGLDKFEYTFKPTFAGLNSLLYNGRHPVYYCGVKKHG